MTDTNCAALGGSDSTVGNLVRCEGLGLDPAGSLDLVIDFEVPSTTDSTTIENQASLAANELAEDLPSSTASLVVSESVALSVEKTFLPATLAAGSSGGSFAVTVTNAGLSDADTVRVTDVIDSRLLVTSAMMDGGECFGAAALECELGHLAVGASADLTVTFDLAATAVPGTIVTNTAQVTSDESPSVSSATAFLVVADFDPLPPTANDDSASTAAGTAVTVVVLGNDGDPQGDALVVQGVSKPDSGSVSINAEGTVTYTPEPGYVGQDSFDLHGLRVGPRPNTDCAPKAPRDRRRHVGRPRPHPRPWPDHDRVDRGRRDPGAPSHHRSGRATDHCRGDDRGASPRLPLPRTERSREGRLRQALSSSW